jgi:ribosomal-protein-alanine N-acetyltransferase
MKQATHPDDEERVRLIPATPILLDLEEISGEEAAKALGVKSPPSWPPEFNGPETRQWIREQLQAQPGSTWYSWYVVARIDGEETLAGICGFKGPPDATATVEIGYSIVPELQRMGHATMAVRQLCQLALSAGVRRVLAETLPVLAGSQGVLVKAGFERFETYVDPEAGEVWRYQRAL